MHNRSKILALAVLLCLLIGVLVISLPQSQQPKAVKSARFVLSSWDYPDEYGQGMFKMIVYENSTGGWLIIDDWIYWSDPPVSYECEAGVGLKIRVLTTVNATLVGVASVEEGKNYQRHNVTVLEKPWLGEATVVFSQQNFTDSGESDEEGDLYYYDYSVVLGFLPLAGQTYYVTICYEIFW